tara:strand:- start:996 stop:1241 length:246 start_codon:yes stop_codon:yes gene_type:complete
MQLTKEIIRLLNLSEDSFDKVKYAYDGVNVEIGYKKYISPAKRQYKRALKLANDNGIAIEPIHTALLKSRRESKKPLNILS